MKTNRSSPSRHVTSRCNSGWAAVSSDFSLPNFEAVPIGVRVPASRFSSDSPPAPVTASAVPSPKSSIRSSDSSSSVHLASDGTTASGSGDQPASPSAGGYAHASKRTTPVIPSGFTETRCPARAVSTVYAGCTIGCRAANPVRGSIQVHESPPVTMTASGSTVAAPAFAGIGRVQRTEPSRMSRHRMRPRSRTISPAAVRPSTMPFAGRGRPRRSFGEAGRPTANGGR